MPFFKSLESCLAPFLANSYSPYAHQPQAALVLLSDGQWVPGVRVENIAFPLTISALMNAVTSAIAIGRKDIVGVYATAPFQSWDYAYLEAVLRTQAHTQHPHYLALADGQPKLDKMASLTFQRTFSTPQEVFTEARQIAHFAYIPHSDFPVSALLKCENNVWIQGCNVEADDWAMGLCAERNALGTAVTFGLKPLELYISCPKALDENPTPCGACRQVIAEQFADKKILIDKGNRMPQVETSASLLPFSFQTKTLG